LTITKKNVIHLCQVFKTGHDLIISNLYMMDQKNLILMAR